MLYSYCTSYQSNGFLEDTRSISREINKTITASLVTRKMTKVLKPKKSHGISTLVYIHRSLTEESES